MGRPNSRLDPSAAATQDLRVLEQVIQGAAGANFRHRWITQRAQHPLAPAQLPFFGRRQGVGTNIRVEIKLEAPVFKRQLPRSLLHALDDRKHQIVDVRLIGPSRSRGQRSSQQYTGHKQRTHGNGANHGPLLWHSMARLVPGIVDSR